jgi:hypothetical protein
MSKLKDNELDAMVLNIRESEEQARLLRALLKEQVQEFGFCPPRAEKSKRLETAIYQLTVSVGTKVTLRDNEIEKIRQACEDEIFEHLFVSCTRYSLHKGALLYLSASLPKNAPRNLRQMFQCAVLLEEQTPSLKIEDRKAEKESVAV